MEKNLRNINVIKYSSFIRKKLFSFKLQGDLHKFSTIYFVETQERAHDLNQKLKFLHKLNYLLLGFGKLQHLFTIESIKY